MKGWAIGFLVVVAVWYGFVLLVIPPIFTCPPGHYPLVRTFLRGHIVRAHRGIEEFGDLEAERLKYIHVELSRANRYTIAQVLESDGEVLGLFVQPCHPRNYKNPLWGRLLLLDFESYAVPTYIVRRDGLICNPQDRRFDAGEIPSAQYVASLDARDFQDNCEATIIGEQ